MRRCKCKYSPTILDATAVLTTLALLARAVLAIGTPTTCATVHGNTFPFEVLTVWGIPYLWGFAAAYFGKDVCEKGDDNE